MANRTRLILLGGAALLLSILLFADVPLRWADWQAHRRATHWLAERNATAWQPTAEQATSAPALLHALNQNAPPFLLLPDTLPWQLAQETAWVRAHYAPVFSAPPYEIWQHQPLSRADAAVRRPQNVRLADQYHLHQATIAPAQFQAGDGLAVELALEATHPPTRTARLILQLLPPLEGQPYAAIDIPLPRQNPLGWWQAGQTIREGYILTPTADIPVGAYPLVLAARPAENPQRLPLFQGTDANPQDRVVLGYTAVPWRGQLPPTLIPLHAQLGQHAHLLGYTLDSGDWTRGTTTNLTLYWQAIQPTAQNHTVFIHLLDESGGYIWGQDAPPRGGTYPTQGWYAPSIIPDPHAFTLPTDLPPGTYTLAAGLYEPSTGTRLPVVQDGASRGNTAVVLTKLEIQ